MTMDPATRRRQERRLGGLHALSLAAALGAPVLFGAYVVAEASAPVAGGAAAAAALLGGGLMLWLRRSHPPSLESSGEAEEEDPTDDDSGWDVGTLLFAATVVPLFVVVAVLVRFMLPLGVILGFWWADGDASFGSVLLAAGCCLAVLAAVEFGVELPLSRRWGLPLDGKPTPRQDYCPPPASGA